MYDRQHFGNVSTRLQRLWLPLVASCLLATGCSMIKAGYDNMPTLAMWRMGSYVTLNAEQRQIAVHRIEALHDWHRSTQLGDYAEFLRSVQRQVANGPVDAAQLSAWRLEIVERLVPIVDQAVPGVVDVAATLQPAQLKRLKTEFDRRTDRYKREWMPEDPVDRLQARSRRLIERAEMFVGNLSESQKQLVKQAVAEFPADNEDAWLAQRVGRQQEMLAVLERLGAEQPPAAVAQQWVREHLTRYARPADPSIASELERGRARSDAVLAAVLAEATPAQRKHLDRKLQEWIDIVQQLRGAQPVAGMKPA
jgi:hypothetical protein